MFHSKKLNNRINSLHERALRVVYKDNNSNLTFEELLKKDNSFTIHERNLQKLAILMYKVRNGLCPLPVKEIFSRNDCAPELRSNENGEDWVVPKVRTENYGIETLRYRGPVTWNLVPNDIKLSKTFEIFKAKIVEWKPLGCKCKLCKPYAQNLGYYVTSN